MANSGPNTNGIYFPMSIRLIIAYLRVIITYLLRDATCMCIHIVFVTAWHQNILFSSISVILFLVFYQSTNVYLLLGWMESMWFLGKLQKDLTLSRKLR